MFFSMNTTLEDMTKFAMLLTPSAKKLGNGAIDKGVIKLIQDSGNPEAYGGGYG